MAPAYPQPRTGAPGGHPGGYLGAGPSSWPSGPMPPVSPPAKGKGLLIGLVVVALLAVTGLVGGGVVVWQNRDDGSETATEPDASPSEEPSEDPSEDPSDEPSEDPSEEPTDPIPSDPPTTEPDPAPPADGSFTFAEFSGDWDFRLDDVALQASFVRGWDYDACAEISVDGAMGDIGCRKSSELSFRGLGGRAAFSHVIMTMKSPAAAKRAIDKNLITGSNWTPQKEAFLKDGSGGTFVAKHVGTFVVISVETHLTDVPDKRASKFLNYMNADFTGALSFR